MAIPLGAALLKELLLGAAVWGGFEVAKRGIGWIGRKIAEKSAQKAAQAGAKAAAQKLGAKGMAAMTAEQIMARIAELERLAAAAEAAGDLRSARAYRGMATKLAEPLAAAATTAQIGREKWWDRAVTLAGVTGLGIFTYEEFRQAASFRENLMLQREMSAQRDAVTRAMIEAMKERIGLGYAQMTADERNRAFWAWYMQQKFELERMKQQAALMKQGLFAARSGAGRRRGGSWDKQTQAAVKAYESAVKTAHRAWLEWQKYWMSINREQIKAQNELASIAARGKWDAFLEAMKHAYETQEIAMRHYAELQQTAAKAQWDMMKTVHETQQKAALKAHEAELEAALYWQEAAAKAAKARAEAEAKMRVISEEAIWERLNEIGKQYGEAAKASIAELYKRIREAEEAIKEGKEYSITLPVWTPQGFGTATIRTKGRRIKVDIDDKAKKIALRQITKVFWK